MTTGRDTGIAGRQLDRILSALIEIMRGNFGLRLPVADPNGIVDSIHSAINMTAEELARTTVSKGYVENVIHSMADMLIVCNPDWTIRTVNRAACDVLGHGSGELVGCGIASFLAEEEAALDLLDTRLKKLVLKGTVRDLDALFKAKDGTHVPTTINGSAMRDAEGKLEAIVIVARDMRETRRLIAEAERAALAESVFEGMLEAITVFGLDGRILYVNGEFERGCGLKRQEVIGKTAAEAGFPSEQVQRVEREVIPQLMAQGFVKHFEATVTSKDGTTFPALMSWSVLKDAQGNPRGVVNVARDITEFKRAEEESQRLAAAMRASNDGVVVLDMQGRIVDVNDAALRLHGTKDKREHVGKSVLDFVVPEDRERAIRNLAELVEAESVGTAEYSVTSSKGNESIPVEASGALIRDADGTPIGAVTVLRDISERKRAEQGRRAYRRNLRRLASELCQFEERGRKRIATGLHDNVSTVLFLAKLRLEMLEHSAAPDKVNEQAEEVRALVEKAIRNTRSLTFEVGSPTLYELGLEAAVRELADEFQEDHGLTVRFETDEEPESPGEVFQLALFRAVRECLVNVVKHAQASEVCVSVRRDAGNILISVEDDGIGFDASEIGPHRGRKAGLGLFSIRERLGYLGGRFEIESGPGRGTKAVLSAPLARDREGEGGDAK